MRNGLVLAVCGLLAACQDDSDTAEKCDAYAENYCKKYADCAIYYGDSTEAQRAQDEQSCHAQLDERGLSCTADSVAANYDQCLADLDGYDCTQFYSVGSGRTYIPLSCHNLIGD